MREKEGKQWIRKKPKRAWKSWNNRLPSCLLAPITRKTVNGKIYFYQRWSENGKRREKYIPLDEVDAFREQIEHRKTLEQEIKALRRGLPKVKKAELLNFITNVRTGNTLRTFADAVIWMNAALANSSSAMSAKIWRIIVVLPVRRRP